MSERDVALPPHPTSPAGPAAPTGAGASAHHELVDRVLTEVGEAFAVVGASGHECSSIGLDWARCDGPGLRSAAKALARVVAALEHQQRVVLALVDERGAFSHIGARDVAEWATVELGMSRGRALDQVEIARGLENLPGLARAAARGALSTEQAKPATELAAIDGDAQWRRNAENLPVATLKRRAAKARRPSSADHAAARKARHFQCWERGQELHYRGSLPIDDGRRLLAAIERAMPPRTTPDEAEPSTLDQRRADGLVALARQQLATDTDPDRATIVGIVELAAVCDDDPHATAELEDSQPLATDTARRLLCDSRVQLVVQDRSGVVVGVGTTSRTVSPGMRRAVNLRDGRCRFGQCTAVGFRLEAHHVVPWPSPTTMGNLAMLCWHHHHAVHEGGWRLHGDPNGALHATSPDGTATVTSRPMARSHADRPPGPAPGSLLPSEADCQLGSERTRSPSGRAHAEPPSSPTWPGASEATGAPGDDPP